MFAAILEFLTRWVKNASYVTHSPDDVACARESSVRASSTFDVCEPLCALLSWTTSKVFNDRGGDRHLVAVKREPAADDARVLALALARRSRPGSDIPRSTRSWNTG